MDEVKREQEGGGGEGAAKRRDKRKMERKRGSAGVEGQQENEGRKDRSCDKSEGGGVISTPLLCVLQALQVNREWNFKTLHLHELDRPLKNTRVTFAKATL